MYVSLPRRIVQTLGEGQYSVSHQYKIGGELYWVVYKTVEVEHRFLFFFPYKEKDYLNVGTLYVDKGMPFFESEDENICKIVDAANLTDIHGHPLKVVLSWRS